MSKIILAEQASAPDTPGSGKVALYVDDNGDLSWKDDAGNITKIASAGAYTLTVPASGTAALIARAQTWTATQSMVRNGYPVIDLYASAGGTVLGEIYNNGIVFYERDLSTGPGTVVSLFRNSNASTPAAGYIQMRNRNDTAHHIWPDASGNLRIGSSTPTYANDTSGTVVGTQTSMADAKYIQDDLSSIADVLARLLNGADAVRRFRYRAGSYGGQEFEGVVTDLAPAYGMDRDEEHPQGKSLNEITILGDLVRAVAYLVQRIG